MPAKPSVRSSVQTARSSSAHPFSFAMLSHPGRVRKGNEDTCQVSLEAGAFVVCDGMGGAAAGEIASHLAAETFLAHLAPIASIPAETLEVLPRAPRRATPDARLDTAIHAANQAVFQHSRTSAALRGMGTTLVALLLEPPGTASPGSTPSLTLAHVGDSRCYRFRAGSLTLLTQDHSLVEEQLRSGQITAFQAEHHPMRNIITRAVGSQPAVEPEIQHLGPLPGDLFLLASDGLTRELSDSAIASTLHRAFRPSSLSPDRALDLDRLARNLVQEANDAGGGDNITVLLLQIH